MGDQNNYVILCITFLSHYMVMLHAVVWMNGNAVHYLFEPLYHWGKLMNEWLNKSNQIYNG